MLRLLRLLRVPLRGLLVLVLAGKGKTIEDNKKKPDKLAPVKHLMIATLDEGGNTKEYSKGDLSLEKDGKPLWIDFQDITEEDLVYIEETTEISGEEIRKKLIEGSFPRIDAVSHDYYSIISLFKNS